LAYVLVTLARLINAVRSLRTAYFASRYMAEAAVAATAAAVTVHGRNISW
jgi:hypothetical protein